MAKKEFDSITGKLKPDYPKKPIPSHLEEVDMPAKPDINKAVKLGWSDIWNVIKAIFRNESLRQLEGSPGLVTAILGIRYIIYLIVGVIALVGIVWAFKSIL